MTDARATEGSARAAPGQPESATTTGAARAAAALIALIAFTGVAVQFSVVYRTSGSVTATIWALLAYFTITTNLLVAFLFGWIALRGGVRELAWLLAGTALSILLVGVVYEVLLSSLYHLSGAAAFSNVLVHRLTPVLVPLYWLAFAPKGRLASRDPLLWGVYPLAYLAYALARGQLAGVYAYPFIDVAHLGWARTALNVALITLGYLIVGWALVLLDRRLAPRSEGPAPGKTFILL